MFCSQWSQEWYVFTSVQQIIASYLFFSISSLWNRTQQIGFGALWCWAERDSTGFQIKVFTAGFPTVLCSSCFASLMMSDKQVSWNKREKWNVCISQALHFDIVFHFQETHDVLKNWCICVTFLFVSSELCCSYFKILRNYEKIKIWIISLLAMNASSVLFNWSSEAQLNFRFIQTTCGWTSANQRSSAKKIGVELSSSTSN